MLKSALISSFLFTATNFAFADTLNDFATMFDAANSASDECRTSRDCFPTSEYYCLNGQCVWVHSIDRCFSDFDCGFPDRCVDGKCVSQ